ncbi:MAG: AEC family transporter [Clostridia bacterium]|nr:AEC family transporter [Clostridia bacterium]
MEMFLLVSEQLLMMLILMAVGFILSKKKIIPENSGTVVSKLENFVFAPALTLVTQFNNCSIENFMNNSNLIIYGLILVIISVGIASPLSKLFVKNPNKDFELDYQRNIYRYALTFGNFGYMGNFLVLGIWGSEALFKYLMFTFFVSVVCYSWGIYILIPKGNGTMWQNLKKGLTAPPIIALVIGIIGGLSNANAYMPAFVMTALDNASKCMGPAAMLLAGIIIGGYDFKELLKNKKVYVVSTLRMFVIPAVFVIALHIFGVSKEIITFTLIAFATPLGMNTIVYPAAYGGDTKTGASMTMISHVLSIITIPVMYYLFVILL